MCLHPHGSGRCIRSGENVFDSSWNGIWLSSRTLPRPVLVMHLAGAVVKLSMQLGGNNGLVACALWQSATCILVVCFSVLRVLVGRVIVGDGGVL
jgi:hypothetical protein